MLPEGEKLWGGPVVMVGIICPPPVGIGLTDLPNIGGPVAPPAPKVPAALTGTPGFSDLPKALVVLTRSGTSEYQAC